MCVIIDVPANTKLDEAMLERCFKANKDGWGIMWAEDDDVHYVKDVTGWHDFLDYWRDVPVTSNRAVHFRIKTHGLINQENCHPFKVAGKEESGMGLMLMHNGYIRTDMKDKDKSDTWNFVEHKLKPFLSKFPAAIHEPLFLELIEEKIGAGSKVMFMTDDGTRYFLGFWHKAYGHNISNVNSCYPVYTSNYPSGGNGYYNRNYPAAANGFQNGYSTDATPPFDATLPAKTAVTPAAAIAAANTGLTKKQIKKLAKFQRKNGTQGYADEFGYYEDGMYHYWDAVAKEQALALARGEVDDPCHAANQTEAAEKLEDDLNNAQQQQLLPPATEQLPALPVPQITFADVATAIHRRISDLKNSIAGPMSDAYANEMANGGMTQAEADQAELDNLYDEMADMTEAEMYNKVQELGAERVTDFLHYLMA